MKQIYLKTFLLALFTIFGMRASAYDVCVDGIYYNLNKTDKTASVTYGKHSYSYHGDIIIPESIIYGGITYSVTSIGRAAFYGCSSLTSVVIPNSVTSIGNSAFSDCSDLTSVEIPNSVTSIGEFAFSGCSDLTSVVIPNSVTSIGNSAFSDCSDLTSVEIPNSVTSINGATFAACWSLTSVEIPNSVTSIGEYAFSGCLITSVVIPNSVTSIGKYAFDGCSNLTSIEIPNSVTSIGEYAFSDCLGLTSVVIPNSVTSIGRGVFYGCSSLTSIEISNGVMSIGDGAFEGCTGLISIEIPNSVTSIGNEAFSDCLGLTSVVISNGVMTIGDGAFVGCTGLISIEIPNSVTSIGDEAFSGCLGLTSVEIPNGVTSIGHSAFEGCTGLTSIEISNSVTSIGVYAFSGCSSLTSIEIPNSVTSIGEFAFSGCSNLRTVNITDIAAWCNIFFYDETSNPLYYVHHLYLNGEEVKDLVIPDGVTSIGEYAFSGCSITSVVIPNSVTSIGNSAFGDCTGLISIEIPNSVTKIDNYAFYGCSSLTKIISHIEKPFSINYSCFNSSTYNIATLYVPVQSIKLYESTVIWRNFKDIRPLALQVIQTELIRKPKQIHIHLMFSFEPNEYTALDEYISLASKNESLKLLSFAKSGQSYDLYFENPKKEGVYTLKVSNAIMDVTKQELDQNGNGISGDDDDNYTEDFVFGNNELYVVAQSPTTGVKGEKGYTDVVLNDEIGNIPVSQCSLQSPSRKYATITKIEYLENLNPARHRIYYDALDEDGIYTFTLHKGMKSAKDWEMRYDYQSTIELPCADLTPVIFTGLENNYIVGQKHPVTYQVENKGTMPANGSSINVLYLSPTDEWSNEAIEIYRDTVDVHVESQENYTRTIDVTIPPCIDGQYYLILKTNVARTINELSYDDNTMASEAFNLSVDWLSEDNSHFTLARGESRLFKIPVTSDKNIEVIDKDGNANMYVGYGVFPDTNNESKKGSVVILSPDESMTYYLLVSNDNKNQEKSQSCELSNRQFDIDIASIGRENVVKHKTAWIPIEVKGCTDMPTFYLTDSQGKRTECKNVRAKTESSFYAQFDTEELRVGKYNLYVECDGKTGMMPNAITIKQEEAQPSIDAKLVLPNTSRIGSTITAYIDYKNTGNVDVTAPLFILTGQERSKYSLDDHEFVTDEVHIMGINEKGVMSALLPGESNRISVKITIPNEHIYSAKYKLKTISEGGDGIDEKFYLQWLDVDPDEKPNCYTDEEWDKYCTRLRNNVGDTWLTFIQALGTVADMYFSSDNIEHDAHFLYDLLREINIEDYYANVRRNVNQRKGILSSEDEPGTIYLFNGGTWFPLVEALYVNGKFNGWKQTEHCSKLKPYNSTDYFFISHGMNNNHTEGWIKQMASALNNKGSIITVDWGRWAKAGGPLPWVSGGHVVEVSARLQTALNTAFNGYPYNNINISKFHFIGHSHGAHVCGRLANRYTSKAKRLTALDQSEESSHWYRSQLENRWNASYIDYYKSSVICGTEWLVGDDNFILSSGDGQFTINPIKDIARHGYAYDWFTETILNNSDVGFNWFNIKNNHPKVTNHKGWAGVINGPKNIIEDYSNYADISDWNYPTPWYNPSINSRKASEWEFRTALASTLESEPMSIDYYNDDKYIKSGTTQFIKVRMSNKADNLSVPLDIRQNETKKKVKHVLFVSSAQNGNNFSIGKSSESNYIYSSSDLYYLAELGTYLEPEGNSAKGIEAIFQFNITPDLWKKLGGTDKIDYLDCDFWIITAVDKSKKYKQAPIKTITLWRGELYPQNNCKKIKLKVQNPYISCNAGEEQTIYLSKGQKDINVHVNGTVLRDNGKKLSYYWEKAKTVFSKSKVGTILLNIGKHSLTFRIKAKDENNAKASFAPTSSANEASDNVIITIKPYTPGDEDDESTNTASSWDPNEKVGIKGAGGKSCVRQGETMEYAIYFENDAEKAQLAAQTVTVIDTLDTAFDLSTFEFTGSEVANTIIDIPSGKAETIVYTDLRPANNLILKTDMKLDFDTRVLKVVYSSLDTLTYEPTQDVFAGFLPPNDSTHVGEGHFSYRVKLRDDVADGYVVKNQAHIFFDYNDEIATNITNHTIDSTAPISAVDGLPSETEKDSIMVSWSGIDEGAGIKYFDVYRSKNGGGYELWKSHVTEHSAILYGVKGDVYRFYSVATDSLNFVETMKTSPDATITFTGDPSSISTVGNEAIGIEYQNGAFVITGAEGATCNIYDLAGQLLASRQRIARRERMVFSKKGVYVVNVETTDGVTVAKKMVVK